MQVRTSGIFLDIRSALGRGNHQADAQHPAGVVRAVLFADGPGDNRVYRAGAGGDHPADGAAAAPDAGDDRATAQGSGDTGTLRRRPAAHIAGDDGAVSSERGESDRVPGAADCADAHTHRAVPGADSDVVRQPGRPGEAFGQAVLVDYLRADSRGGSGEQPIPVDGLEPSRPVAHRDAGAGGGNHVGAAKDDADAVAGPASAIQPDNDAVDDAHIPGGVFAGMAQRLAAVLGGFQPHRHRNSVLYYRLGAVVPPVPATRRAGGRIPGNYRGSCPRPAGE